MEKQTKAGTQQWPAVGFTTSNTIPAAEDVCTISHPTFSNAREGRGKASERAMGRLSLFNSELHVSRPRVDADGFSYNGDGHGESADVESLEH